MSRQKMDFLKWRENMEAKGIFSKFPKICPVVRSADGDVTAVSRFSQANAPLRCLLADCASGASLADDRLSQTQPPRAKGDGLDKHQRSLWSLRKKRLRRNKQKKEALKNMSRQQKKTKYSRIANLSIQALEVKLNKVEQDHKHEKRLSACCWKRYKGEKEKKLKVYKVPNNINRENLIEECQIFLGKGAFGSCRKMIYRGIDVAVKMYEDHVEKCSVTWEANVINMFDHPGLPLLFGVCLDKKPYLLITQFHGINGKCATFRSAMQSGAVNTTGEWTNIFKETAKALLYVHEKGLLHNDIKGDNILLSSGSTSLYPVLIDFGKCRKSTNPKRYKLTMEEQKKYFKHHWHLAPELIKGTHSQSFASDVYSFGILISQMCEMLSKDCEVLKFISKKCICKNPHDRLTLNEILDKLK